MGKVDYERISEKTFLKIKQVRNEYSVSEMTTEINKSISFSKRMFDVGGEDYSNYNFIINNTKTYIYDFLKNIIMTFFDMDNATIMDSIKVMLPNKEYHNMPITDFFRDYKAMPVIALLKKEENGQVLFLFREFGIQNKLPKSKVIEVMNVLNADSIMDISLVHNDAHYECISPGAMETYGTMSFGKFFVDNFGSNEYSEFKEFEESFTKRIREYLGYEVVKKLNPNALFSFKKRLEKIIYSYDYLLNCSELDDIKINQIKQQYFDKSYYRGLVSNKDFAVSFMTAEWMFTAINNGGKIDLTAIAMGYFKSIEEFLFGLISIHADGTKQIYCSGNKYKGIPKGLVTLDESCLKKFKKYIMLDSLIEFVNNNRSIFNDDADENLIKFFIKLLQRQKQIRNGFFHKENLDDWNIVEEARNKAFVVFFLGLGLLKVPNDKKKILGIPDVNDQYTILCDYINYHADNPYYISQNGEEYFTSVGQYDDGITYDEFGTASYTGVYFNKINGFPTDKAVLKITRGFSIDNEKISYNKKNLQIKIYKGTMMQSTKENGIEFSGPQKLIWENGKFFGDIIDKE